MAQPVSDEDFNAALQSLSGPAPAPAAPASTPASSGPVSDAEFNAAIQGLSGDAPPASSPTGNTRPQIRPSVPRPQATPQPQGGGSTPFQRSVAPPSAPTVSWGQAAANAIQHPDQALSAIGHTAQQAGQNFLPSLGGAVSSIVDAVAHPIRTVQSVAQLGTGLASQAAGALGMKQDPQQAARAQALARSLEHHYATAYGSASGFQQAVSSDPASILMDASTFLDGAGVAADAAKLGDVAKLLHAASPINVAGKVVGAPLTAAAKLGTGALRGAQSVWSGAPYSALRNAAIVGTSDDPVVRGAFLDAMHGNVDPGDYLTRAQNAISSMKRDRSDAYLAKHADIANTPVDYSNTYNALDTADQQLGLGSKSLSAGSRNVMAQARQAVDEVANNPETQTVAHADALKKQMWNFAQSTGDPAASDLLKSSIYNAVKADITNVSPEYASMMEQYQKASSDINSLQKGLVGSARNPASLTAMGKGLRALKTPEGNSLLEEMGAKDPTIVPTLAGAALSPWMRGGAAGTMEWIANGGLFSVLHNPAIAVGMLGAQSPRIGGEINYNLGRLGAGAAVGNKIGAAMGPAAYYAARANEESPPDAAGSPAPLSQPSAPEGVMQANSPSDPGSISKAILAAEGTGNNPYGSAKGPYQMIDPTFISMFRKMYPQRAAGMSDAQIKAIRTTPEGADLSAEMGPHLVNDEYSTLQNAGVETTPANVYLAHFLNPIEAIRTLKADPSTPTSQFYSPKVINSNPSIMRGKTVGDVINWTHRRMAEVLPEAQNEASGGRIQRADGGSVSIDALVDKLMERSEQVKRERKKVTKPLLHLSDNTVAQALQAAKQSVI